MLFEEACLPIGEVLKKYGLILGHPDDYDQSPTCNLRKKKRIHNKSDLKAVENNDKTY